MATRMETHATWTREVIDIFDATLIESSIKPI